MIDIIVQDIDDVDSDSSFGSNSLGNMTALNESVEDHQMDVTFGLPQMLEDDEEIPDEHP